MGLIDFPNPASWYATVKDDGLKRDEINAFVSDLAQQAELLEVVRSGALGIGRNARPLRVVR